MERGSAFLDDALEGDKYENFARFSGLLLNWYRDQMGFDASLLVPETSMRLSSFTDFVFSVLYSWNAIYLKQRRPVTCDECGATMYSFTNYCPNHEWAGGRFPTIKKTFGEWNKLYQMKPEEDIVGDMGGGIMRSILNEVTREGFTILENLESPNRVVQADYAIVSKNARPPLALLIEAKVHPAVYLPAFIRGSGESNPFAVELASERPTLSDFLRSFLDFGLERFLPTWNGLIAGDESFSHVRGLMAGAGHKADDSKNKPGIERTDDFKKALAQALIFSALRPLCNQYDLRSAIFSNVFPRGGRGTLMESLGRQWLTNGSRRWPILSAVVGLTRNVFNEDDVRSAFR